MTVILALAAIFTLIYAIGLRARTTILHRQLAEERFANQVAGIDITLDGPPMIVIPMAKLFEELHFNMWEYELEDTEP